MIDAVGKYSIVGMIEKGSSASVYLGHDPVLDIQVAIKVFFENTPDFMAEAKRLHLLSSSPHVISFMDYGFVSLKTPNSSIQSQVPYLVMPYCKRSLASVLGKDLRLSVSKSIELCLSLSKGLATIHKANMLHLDLKPANILLNDDDSVFIIDFGISQESNKNDPANEMSSTYNEGEGTPDYASPEQLSGESPISSQSDFYALGLILFRCLFGRAPIRSEINPELINSYKGPNKALYQLLHHLLAENPHNRPSSTDIIISELESFQRQGKQVSESIDAMHIDGVSRSEHAGRHVEEDHALEDRAQLNDDETQAWKYTYSASPISAGIKDRVRELLLEQGEIHEDDFDSLSLIVKAEIHEKFDAEEFKQFIHRVYQQLKRENPAFSRFVLWLEQVNEALALATNEATTLYQNGATEVLTGSTLLDVNQREKLIALGEAVLTDNRNVKGAIEQAEIKAVDKLRLTLGDVSVNAVKKGPNIFSLAYLRRFLAVIFVLTLAALIPNVKEFSSNQSKNEIAPIGAEIKNAKPSNETLSSEKPSSKKVSSKKQNADAPIKSGSTESVKDSLGKAIEQKSIELTFDIIPEDAVVSIQSMDGNAVSANAITDGSYIVRVSKNGYATAKRQLTLNNVSRYVLRERLLLSDSRYFIGNTDITVADGIPVEFILLPESTETTRVIRMMSTEVTNELYAACVKAAKCSSSSRLSTDQRAAIFTHSQHPVVNISWYDINEQFIPWLSAITGTELRLPTEQEWMHASLAGSQNVKYAWGNNKAYGKAHCKQCNSAGSIPNTFNRTTMPVKSFPANKWQLYDMHGNVQEWVADCGQAASSNLAQRCDQAIIKGGSWFSNYNELSAQHRVVLKKTVRSHTTGFRLVEIVGQ